MAKLNERIDIFLQPGEYMVADSNYQIRTLLGSCVSMTLWHPGQRVGAMSHFLLPRRALCEGEEKNHEMDARYGDEALALMVSELAALGIAPSHCQGKIFGGGDMFPSLPRQFNDHVGRKNGDAARDLLRRQGVPIVSESLFGVGHRQILFDISSGDVWARQVRLAPALVATGAGVT